MVSKSLSSRTADFLSQYPPFSFIPREELEVLASKVKITYYGKDEDIFQEDQSATEILYFLHKGQVDFYKKAEGSQKLIDVCDVGDSFGIRSFISGNPFLVSARVSKEALVYLFTKDTFEHILENYPKVSLYFASGFASGQPVIRKEKTKVWEARKELNADKEYPFLFREQDVVHIPVTSRVITCSPTQSIKEAATIMAQQKIGSLVVVDEENYPIGILTKSDFTRKVATGLFEITAEVREIMSSPVITSERGETVASVILQMIQQHVRHIVVTEDGSVNSEVDGIISEHDILLAQGNNPAILVKRMLKTKEVEQLAEIRNRAEELTYAYLEQEVSIPFITGIITEINDVLIQRAIEISVEKMKEEGKGAPPVPFCWLSMGSEGRGEQLLRTDQDNALLFADAAEEKLEQAKAYFLDLGTRTTDILEACGFAHCPGEIMASNPKWNGSLSQWKDLFSEWIRFPKPKSLMHGTIFFDIRPTYGETSLMDELTDHLYAEMDRQTSFINFFAQNALGNPPPLSFFKSFMVERGGKHKDEFDIKLRGMMPLADAARVLFLEKRLRGITNTFLRFEELAKMEEHNATLYEEAAMAYELMLRYRALNGFRNQNSGRYINPKSLNKIEKQTLKYAFRTIDDLQSILKTRFSLNIFG
ncbi:MAG: DUF294 nucleotidyltransferase-like domain-containing protein [Bacteroidota bacterium]